jgi:predicted  nucleic acid-binding Zn-ribbon protein
MSELEENKNQTSEEVSESKQPFDDTPSVILSYFEDESGDAKPKVTEKLMTFYKLSKIDQELFEIEEEKGDLPDVIVKLKEKVGAVEKEISEKQNKVIEMNSEKDKMAASNKKTEERLSKYEEQKYAAKSNKEYDDIMKTIDSGLEEMETFEKKMKELTNEIKSAIEGTTELTAKLEEQKNELKEKEEQLAELEENYKSEEDEMKKNYNELLKKLDNDDKNLYLRLKKMFKGEVTSIVRKGNCTGCYNSIPPQKVIEINASEKVFTCESCGRILISEEVIKNNLES